MVRRVLIIVSILCVVSVIAWMDYFWAENRLKNSNLTPVYTRHDWRLIKPWTWLKQPIVEIMWIDQYACPVDPYCYVYFVNEKWGSDIQRDLLLANKKTNRFLIVSEQELKGVNPSDYESHFTWYKADNDGAAGGLIRYLKSLVSDKNE